MATRNLRAALIPSVAVPVSLLGTFGGMYFLGYTLDNLSPMALTISTGFVVDDAIVVLENVVRHLESGMPPIQAATQGAREVRFTGLAMSLLSGLRVCANPADGRARRAVPRVRGDFASGDHDIARRLADNNGPAGDVMLRRLSLYQRPKGFMPEQDNRLIWGGLQADQSISFQLMKRELAQFFEIIGQDPAVAKVVGYHGGGSYRSAYVILKPAGPTP